MHRRGKAVNSVTAKSVPTGTKNSHTEGFLLAKHKHTNIPTMMGPFPPPAAWFDGYARSDVGNLFQRGRARAMLSLVLIIKITV